MARISGAGLNGNSDDGPGGNVPNEAMGINAGGALSAYTRAQYAAMAALRWHIFVNGLRSKMGAFEFGMRTLAFVMYAGFGLAAGAVFGVSAYFVVHEKQWQFLPILFWAVFVLWQLVPVMLASFQEQFDLSILLRFPVSFRSYFMLFVVFGLADVSTHSGRALLPGPLDRNHSGAARSLCLDGAGAGWSLRSSTSCLCAPSLPGSTAGSRSARRGRLWAQSS
jgi:hypothetical protein